MTWITRLLSSDSALSSRRAQAVLATLVSLVACVYDVVQHRGLTMYSTGLLGGLAGVAIGAVAISKPSSPEA